jgi:hypothetical protein
MQLPPVLQTTPTPVLQTHPVTLFAGVLLKQGSWRKNWKQRHFALIADGGKRVLQYGEGGGGGKPKGALDLTTVRVEAVHSGSAVCDAAPPSALGAGQETEITSLRRKWGRYFMSLFDGNTPPGNAPKLLFEFDVCVPDRRLKCRARTKEEMDKWMKALRG